jgi:microcystin-dependent protein
MGEYYIGEIRMAGFNFAPVGWLPCDGSLQSISNYDALYNLIGTTYGGDGQSTFGMPDLRSRVPIHQGTESSGGTYTLGMAAGTESVTLTSQQLGVHTHPFAASSVGGGQQGPGNAYPAMNSTPFYVPDTNPANLVALAPNAIAPQGGSLPHNNIMPYLCVNFFISYQGIYPSQS